ncbi:MAG: adenosylcobinamide-GDP ribazoletransferase, partial [Gammaproteobacteria bacterium]|nr:adenosylcobinamide-GDP ribazoletransferase [Gammaproteobacteria bacterium]
MLKPFLIALQFLTRLPVPQSLLGSEIASDRQLGLSVLMYPLVGLVIGGMLILFPWLVQEFNYQVDAQIMAAIVLFVWVLITGALHLDGLSDSADAWVGGFGDKTRTLEIMKDPYSGPAGVSIIVIVLIAKFAALITIVAMPVITL